MDTAEKKTGEVRQSTVPILGQLWQLFTEGRQALPLVLQTLPEEAQQSAPTYTAWQLVHGTSPGILPTSGVHHDTVHQHLSPSWSGGGSPDSRVGVIRRWVFGCW